MIAADIIARIISAGVSLAPSVEALNDFLRENRRHIDQVLAEAPDSWSALRDETKARRQALAGSTEYLN